jgi:hypothetical protein
MRTTTERMEALIAMLTRDAQNDEDRRRLESVRTRWTSVRAERERKELRILLLVEELREETVRGCTRREHLGPFPRDGEASHTPGNGQGYAISGS